MDHRKVLIELSALESNVSVVEKVSGCPRDSMLAVVKEDAYGHGMVEVSRFLEKIGVKRFGVAWVWEGVLLRESGISGEIYIMGGILEGSELDAFLEMPLCLVASDMEMLDMAAGKISRLFLKFDTGMGRLGFSPDELEPVISLLKKRGARPRGVMSHLSSADEDDEYTKEQIEKFEAISRVLEREFGPMEKQVSNSAHLLRNGWRKGEVARLGIALYGSSPIAGVDFGLKELMGFESVVWQVKRMRKGSRISYGGTCVLERDSIVGVVPVGYAHGYPRLVSGKAYVVVRGRKVPVLGRVTMDWIMIDLTDVGWVEKGERVVVLGEGITAWDIARWADTIPYEVYCMIGSNNRRFYSHG